MITLPAGLPRKDEYRVEEVECGHGDEHRDPIEDVLIDLMGDEVT